MHIRRRDSNVLTIYCSPDVEFCGYSIPHPSEAVLHLRIQTWGTGPFIDHDKRQY